jgi:hypothetical protein
LVAGRGEAPPAEREAVRPNRWIRKTAPRLRPATEAMRLPREKRNERRRDRDGRLRPSPPLLLLPPLE